MRTLLIAGLAFALCATVRAEESPLKIEGAWVRAVPPGSPATAAYMTIRNAGTEAVEFTGGECDFAKSVKPMVTTKKTIDGHEVSGMEVVESLKIPAGGVLVMKPGGDHLMLMKMSSAPAPGTKVDVTLMFEPGARKVTLSMPVAKDAPK